MMLIARFLLILNCTFSKEKRILFLIQCYKSKTDTKLHTNSHSTLDTYLVCVLGLVGPTVAERTCRGKKQLVDKVGTTIFYVDDLVSGATLPSEGVTEESIKVCFRLQDIVTDCCPVLCNIQPSRILSVTSKGLWTLGW